MLKYSAMKTIKHFHCYFDKKKNKTPFQKNIFINGQLE